MKRIFIIVLDSFGIGALPDADRFEDAGADTLASCAASGALRIPNMIAAGLGNIQGVTCLPRANAPRAHGDAWRKSPWERIQPSVIGSWRV